VKNPPRLACSLLALGPHVNPTALAELASLGFGEVEVPIRTAGVSDRYGAPPWLTDKSTAREVREFRLQLSRVRLVATSCVCAAGHLLKPAEVQRVAAKLRVAAELGATVATFEAGEARDSDETRQIYDALRELAETATSLGLQPCLEYARGLSLNHRLQLQVLSELGHPALKASFDPGLLHLLNDQVHAEVALAKSCHQVRHVRLRDFGGLRGVRHFPPLGRGGSIPFVRIYQLLRDLAYRGAWVVAVEGPPTEPHFPLEEYLNRLRESVTFLHRTGCLDRY